MHAIRDALSAQHDTMDALAGEAVSAARAQDWPAYRSRFATLRGALLEHMAYEDEELFPALARALGGEADVALLREQHDELRRQFETLGAAAPEHDPEGCLAEVEALAALLRLHHESEQRVCYPRSDGLRIAHPPQAGPARRSLDLRGLQPPEPIVRIFEALERAPGEPLRAILPDEPAPLYTLLRERVIRPMGLKRTVLTAEEAILHRTAIDPSMTRPRYAIESWFFAPSTYPDAQVPLAF